MDSDHAVLLSQAREMEEKWSIGHTPVPKGGAGFSSEGLVCKHCIFSARIKLSNRFLLLNLKVSFFGAVARTVREQAGEKRSKQMMSRSNSILSASRECRPAGKFIVLALQGRGNWPVRIQQQLQ